MFTKSVIAFVVSILIYTFIGTSYNVDEIKKRAPEEIKNRGWEIMRYEGYQYSSWGRDGGKVWYHVRNTDNKNIQYRISISLWNNELQFYYGEPEKLNRFSVDLESK